MALFFLFLLALHCFAFSPSLTTNAFLADKGSCLLQASWISAISLAATPFEQRKKVHILPRVFFQKRSSCQKAWPMFSVLFFSLPPQTRRNSSQFSSRRFLALSRCLNSGMNLLAVWFWNHWSVSLIEVRTDTFAPGRDVKVIKGPTPSRPFWKRSRWHTYPQFNNCWTLPACHVMSSLKRYL